MNEQTKKYLGWLLVVVAILVAGYLGVNYPIPAPPSFPSTEKTALPVSPPPLLFESQAVQNLAVKGFLIDGTASYTPTSAAVFTPTTGIVNLTPGGDVGLQLGGCTSGSSLLLYDSINSAVVVTDSATAILAGNQTLGQYDSLALVCIGGSWVQVAAVSAN